MPRQNPPQPQLSPVRVPADKLLLWPNNPRLFLDEDLNVPEAKFADPGVQQRAFAQMEANGDPFQLEELKESLRRNGFVPVDFIFVRRHRESGGFVVLEGNRRVTAIRSILEEDQRPPQDRKHQPVSKEIRASLEEVECMEITNDLPDEDLEDMVTYLLGVRHHGSLKQWSPYAKAAHMSDLYLKLSGSEESSFWWDESLAERVAESLCVEPKEVRESIATYRVMADIGRRDEVKQCDGIRDTDYSIVKEALVTGSRAVREYLPIDEERFTVSDETFARLDELCHFTKRRAGAPVETPQEWSALGKILNDSDPQKRDEMLDEVRIQKVPPKVVAGNRNRELQQLTWARWLEQLLVVIKGINFGGIEGNAEEQRVVAELSELLAGLPRT